MKEKTIEHLKIFFTVIIIIISISALTLSYISYKATEPFQKPILYIYEPEASATLLDNGDINVSLLLNFKNYGKGIAHNIRISVYASLYDSPESLIEVVNKTMANDIYPDVIWNLPLPFTINAINAITGEEEDPINTKLAFIIRFDYKDKTSGSIESQTSWMGFDFDHGTYQLTLEKKNELMPYYEELIQDF